MNFYSNAHTHTTYCDGQSDIPAMVFQAQELKFVSLGFSGHAAQGFDADYCMTPEGQNAYRTELRALQKKHIEEQIRPKIYIGLEQDARVPQAQKDENRRDFDYIIGSAHYLVSKTDGSKLAVDGPKDMLARLVRETYGGDAAAMLKAYYRQLADYVISDKPDIIGHFDVVRRHAAALGVETNHPAYRHAALEALEAAFAGCKLMEVNTGNIARGYDTLPYPAAFLLDAWREMGGEITLTSDCHDARYLAAAYPKTLGMLRDMGFKRLLRLGTGTALWDEFAL